MKTIVLPCINAEIPNTFACTLQIQDIGLVFGAAYTILDVQDSDGEQLIKLRNPPGDHEVTRVERRRRSEEGLMFVLFGGVSGIGV